MSARTDTPQIVFACVRNGGRSVISRVLAERYAGGRVTALSAGTQPGDHIHTEVADVLEKLGLDTSQEHPKLLTHETIAASDLAITLGCGEECPYVPGVVYRDWPVAGLTNLTLVSSCSQAHPYRQGIAWPPKPGEPCPAPPVFSAQRRRVALNRS